MNFYKELSHDSVMICDYDNVDEFGRLKVVSGLFSDAELNVPVGDGVFGDYVREGEGEFYFEDRDSVAKAVDGVMKFYRGFAGSFGSDESVLKGLRCLEEIGEIVNN